MVVPNDMGSRPSDGRCGRNSNGASTATRSSFATWLSAVERRMPTLAVPLATGRAASVGNKLLAVPIFLLKLPANDTVPALGYAIKGDRHVEISRTQGAQGGSRASWCEQPWDLRRQGGECRAVGRRWPPLHRFCGRNRGAQHWPSPSSRHGGRGATSAGFHAHLFPRVAVRILRAPG